MKVSVVIPAQDEEQTLGRVLKEVKHLEPHEIIVVVNGSDDNTTSVASNLGATVIEYKERLGHNVGRAIGALQATGDILLFIDAASNGQTQAELRIMGDHLEAISYLIGQLETDSGFHDE
jgi:glycosyltransferase involved in cell wall biosynthesis